MNAKPQIGLTLADAARICYGDTVTDKRVRETSLTHAALAYHAAVQAQQALKGTSDELLSFAYQAIEHAIRTLRKEGTRLDQISALEDQAHQLAPAYERDRALRLDVNDRVRVTRAAMGFERSLARHIRSLAEDDISADTPEGDAMIVKLLDVAEMLDCEE